MATPQDMAAAIQAMGRYTPPDKSAMYAEALRNQQMTHTPQAPIESLKGRDGLTDWALGVRERTLNPLQAMADYATEFKGLDPVDMGMQMVGGGMAGTIGNGVKVGMKEGSNFLSAMSDAGLVGGHVKDGALHISHAEVAEAMRGKGEGIKLYQALVDDAHSKGLKVFSDSTVEADAAKMYSALQNRGYGINNTVAGTLDGGAVYGKGASSPAFEVLPKNIGQK